jgi:hypothetical protein
LDRKLPTGKQEDAVAERNRCRAATTYGKGCCRNTTQSPVAAW